MKSSYPKQGATGSFEIATTSGPATVHWRAPKLKRWRRYEYMKGALIAAFTRGAAAMADAQEALHELVTLECALAFEGVVGMDGEPIETAEDLIERGSSNDLVQVYQGIVADTPLSEREKKASALPPASSDTAEEAPPTGTTPIDGSEGSGDADPAE